MLKDITNILFETKELKPYYRKLDAGEDASLAVVTSARPLVVATDFVAKPRPILVVVAGVKNAKAFASELRSFLGSGVILLGSEARLPGKIEKSTISTVKSAFDTINVEAL